MRSEAVISLNAQHQILRVVLIDERPAGGKHIYVYSSYFIQFTI